MSSVIVNMIKKNFFFFFNLFTLIWNFSLWLLMDIILWDAESQSIPIIVHLILYFGLIILSLSYNYFKDFKEKKYGKFIKYSFTLLSMFYEFIPFIEMLIDLNIAFVFLKLEAKELQILFKMQYFTIKNIVFRMRTESFVNSLIHNCSFVIISTVDVILVLGVNEKNFHWIFLNLICLIVTVLAVLFILNQKITEKEEINSELFYHISEIFHPFILIKGEKKKKYEFFWNNNKFFGCDQKKMKFNEFNKSFSGFERYKRIEDKQKIENEFCSALIINQDKYFSSLIEILNLMKINDIFKCRKSIEKKTIKLVIKKMKIKNEFFYLLLMKNKLKNKKRNELKEKEFKVRLLHTISHELKTPVNASLTIIELLYQHVKSEEDISAHDYMENALSSLKLLENSLNNFIDDALMLTDEFVLSMSDLNIHNLMNEVFKITNTQMKLKNIDYRIEIPSKLMKKTIFTDYCRLKQILLNLVLNSLQFTMQGFIKIHLIIIAKKPLTIEFSIVDSGLGMDPLFLSNLKTKITDEQHDFHANTTGSCMGLSISNKLALLLGNQALSIESIFNEGTTVKFRIIDQSPEKPETKTALLKTYNDFIVISGEIPKNNFYDSVKNFSSQIERIKRRNKTCSKKELSFESIKERSEGNLSNSFRNCEQPSHTAYINEYNFFDKVINSSDTANNNSKKKQNHSTSILENKNFRDSIRMKHSTKNSLEKFNIFENDGNVLPTVIIKSELSINFLDFSCTQSEDCQSCKQILLVDDDAFNLLSLELILKSFNQKCVKALNGKEAIKLVSSHISAGTKCKGFPLIFMDYQMPEMDGVETTKEILNLYGYKEKMHNFNKFVPIIIGCTAFTTKSEISKCLNAGMKDVIFKPLNKEIVGKILETWLKK